MEDGDFVVENLDKEQTTEEGIFSYTTDEGYPTFELIEGEESVTKIAENQYKFVSKSLRPFTSDAGTFDLKTCMKVSFTGGWERFDSAGNRVASFIGQPQELMIT